jgi:hypothetical protein
VDSSAGGVASSSATAVEGSSPSQDRSVDFLQKYTSWLSMKFDYYIKYYSGRLSTYKLYRTIVTVGAPRMLAMSTSPASEGASVVWTSLGPLPRWVPGPTTRWAPGTTRLALHGT